MVDETLCQPEDVSSSYTLCFHSHWPAAEVFQSITQFVKPVCQDTGQQAVKQIYSHEAEIQWTKSNAQQKSKQSTIQGEVPSTKLCWGYNKMFDESLY